MAGRRGGRGNVGERRRNSRRDEEFEIMYGEGTQGQTTGYKPLMPWNKKANQVNAINEYNKYHLDEGTTAMSLPEEGMLSGAWNTIKGFGKHLAENNPVSLRFKEVQANVDAYDKYWLDRLGHAGQPRLEDFKGDTADDAFEEALKLYRSMQPLDYQYVN